MAGLGHHAEANLLRVSEAHQRPVHPAQVGRAVIGDGDGDTHQQRAHRQLARPSTAGHGRLELVDHPRGVDDRLQGGEVDPLPHRRPPSTDTRVASSDGGS